MNKKRLIKAMQKELHEVEQALGKALGYPAYAGDQKNFPGATEEDGVCVGEHTPGTLAVEAAQRLVASNTDLLKPEYLQTPFADPEWDKYLELAREYHSRCDAFDAMVCTGTHKGTPMPSNQYERRAVNINARDICTEIEIKAAALGLCAGNKLTQAIIHVARGAQP